MDQLKDVAAWMMLASFFLVILIALFLGLKAIYTHIVEYGTYKQKQRESQEEIAAYKEQVKQLSLKAKSTSEPVVS